MSVLNAIREAVPEILTDLEKSVKYLEKCKNYLLRNGERKALVCFTAYTGVSITVSVFSITEEDRTDYYFMLEADQTIKELYKL